MSQYFDGAEDDDLYGILGVHRGSTLDELRAGRRLQALKWHPDRNQGTEALRRMAAINNAFQVLRDPRRRQVYDQSIQSRTRRGPRQRPPKSGALAQHLEARGFKVVDNREAGGVLWVLDNSRVEPVLEDLRQRGVDFEFVAAGGVATGFRPAWWTRDWD
ncbi:MAG: J domain-containing protein [Candidatus Dormibacteria bacterium]